MSKRGRPVRELVELLAEIQASAQRGNVTGALILYRSRDGSWDFSFHVPDVNDCLFELRTAAIQMRADYGGTGE